MTAEETLEHIGWSEFAPIHAACVAEKPSFLDPKKTKGFFSCGYRDDRKNRLYRSHTDHHENCKNLTDGLEKVTLEKHQNSVALKYPFFIQKNLLG